MKLDIISKFSHYKYFKLLIPSVALGLVLLSYKYLTRDNHQYVLYSPQAKQQFLTALLEAEEFLYVGTYKLQSNNLPDAEILSALKMTASKVPTTVFTESRITQEELRGNTKLPQNAALETFKNTKAVVISNLPKYKTSHAKFMITKHKAIVSNTNYDKNDQNYVTRDFSILINDENVINEMKMTFDLASSGKEIDWPKYSIDDIGVGEFRLTWGPKQHKGHIIEMIKGAKNKIIIYQQDLQDTSICEELIIKSKEEVDIMILMSQFPFGENNPNKSMTNLIRLAKAGVKIRLTGEKKTKEGLPLHVHAKVIIVDDNIMYLGSANFYPSVLDPEQGNLNLGIATKKHEHVDPVASVFLEDWLSHEGCDLVTKK